MGTLVNGLKDIFSTPKNTGTNVMLCGNDGTPDGHITFSNLIKESITDNAQLGNGYTVCSTASNVAAKEVTIPNFVIKTGAIVSVLFYNGFTASNSTLTVKDGSGTAIVSNAPIYYHGAAVYPSVVTGGSVVVLQYYNGKWNVISKEYYGSPETDLWVDMGLPSGVKWAKRNIDVTQPNRFASSEYTYDASFFSWGNVEGHNPTGTTFDYDFGTSVYAGTPGAALTGNIPLSHDAARVVCGSSWRIPTADEIHELTSNSDFVRADGGTVIPYYTTNKLITINGVVGVYLKSKANGHLLFFPACGYPLQGTTYEGKGTDGVYWSSSIHSNAAKAYDLNFSSAVNPVNLASHERYLGFTIRPVM